MRTTRSLIPTMVAAMLAVALCTASAAPLRSLLPLRNETRVSVHTSDINEGPSCSLTPSSEPICGSTGNTLTATVSGGTPPYTLFWTLTGDGKLTGGQGTDTLTFDIGASGAGVILVFAVTDAVGATAQCSETIFCELPPPPPDFCTLTQGWYGNAGGSFNYTRPLTLIQSLLTGGDLVVGKPGRSLRIQLAAAGCIIQDLPAAGIPRALPSTLNDATLDSVSCQTTPTSLPVNSSGRFSNVLLGQTIALSLNTRLSAGLGDLVICNLMTTQAMLPGPDGLLGTSDDVRNPGPDGALGTSDDPITTVNIPLSVTTALSALGLPRTVNGILELANRALAGQSTGGAGLSDIEAAVNAIDVGFNKCRVLVSCSSL